MDFNKLFVYTAVMILSITGIFAADGLSAFAAQTETGTQATAGSSAQSEAGEQAARTANSKLISYSTYELGCMAKYYYKRTSKDGFYPPEAAVTQEKDGTFTIGLREPVKSKDGKQQYKTYARYNVDTQGKGWDITLKKQIDFTLYSKVYTPEQLCRLSQDYFKKKNDIYPPNAEYTKNNDGTCTICLFEVINDEDGVSHNSTCGWLTVDACGIGTDDLMMEAVDINP